MRARVSQGIWIVLASLLAGAAARAQAPDPAEEAEAAIKHGLALRRQQHDAEALVEFERAVKLRPTARARAQAGLCQQALGHWVAAEENITAAVAEASDPWIRKNRDALDQGLATIRQHVGSLEIVGTPPGAEVRVDDRLVGTLPLAHPTRVGTGDVPVQVSAPGYLPRTRNVFVNAGGIARESFDLRPLPKVAEAPAAAAAPAVAPSSELESSGAGFEAAPRKWQRPTAIAGFAVAGAALVFGIVEHARYYGKTSDFNDMNGCGEKLPNRGGGACAGLYSDAGSAKTGAVVGYVAAGVLAAGSAALFFSAPTREKPAAVASRGCAIDPRSIALACAWVF